MESPLAAILDPWLMRFKTVDWASPRSRGPASIRDLRYVGPCPELLQAAMVYWDPTMRDDEMCPTMEEFQAYLQGFTDFHDLVVPPFQENMEHLLELTHNISEELSMSIIQGGELNIVRLIELYGPEGALRDYVGQAHKRLVLSICALAAYMLIPIDGKVSPSLGSIASQMGARKNIMPIVLAETLMCLDLVKRGQADSFSGYPLLLQLWLPDKIGVLAAPEAGFEHFPRHLVERPMLYPELLAGEWHAFMNDMGSEDIVWRCPWLNLPKMTVTSVGFERVVIARLASFTFYIPRLILRQLGMSLGNQRSGTEDFQPLDFDARNMHNYRCSWNNRELEGPLPDFKTWLESRYVKWLHKEVKAKLGGYY